MAQSDTQTRRRPIPVLHTTRICSRSEERRESTWCCIARLQKVERKSSSQCASPDLYLSQSRTSVPFIEVFECRARSEKKPRYPCGVQLFSALGRLPVRSLHYVLTARQEQTIPGRGRALAQIVSSLFTGIRTLEGVNDSVVCCIMASVCCNTLGVQCSKNVQAMKPD